MTDSMENSEEKSTDNRKRIHDINASLRFLENLHSEICESQNIHDINDIQITNKLKEVTDILKKELSNVIKNLERNI